jgi:branched-chain amino acid transport system ATP-binding protein
LTVTLLEARDLSVRYDRVAVLKSISLAVPAGTVIGLIGHNGAGKSTLLSALAGVTPVDGGSLSLEGRVLSQAEWRSIVRLGVSLVPQGRGVFPAMTVRDNLALGLRAATSTPLDSPPGRRHLDRVLQAVPLLESLLNRRAGQLSGGQQGLVSIGRGLIVDPRVLLLDEPSTGLAPIMVNEILAVIRRLKERGSTSVILVEQNIPQVLDIADYIYVVKAGVLVASGKPETFHGSTRLMELF